MGLKCSPDIAQSIVESVLSGIDDADVYIDDVGAFSKNWGHHIQLLADILCRLPLLNVNGPSRKLTGLVIGLHLEVLSLGKRK